MYLYYVKHREYPYYYYVPYVLEEFTLKSLHDNKKLTVGTKLWFSIDLGSNLWLSFPRKLKLVFMYYVLSRAIHMQ